MTEQATTIFASSANAKETSQPSGENTSLEKMPMKGGPENSKEFVEFNFQVKYTDDEEKPVQAQLDIPIDKKA